MVKEATGRKRTYVTHILAICLLLLSSVAAVTDVSASEPPLLCGPDKNRPPNAEGAIGRICVPPGDLWNGKLVVFAHGYVAPGLPVNIPEDQLILEEGAVYIPDMILGMGFAFATTSYRDNGLVVKEGIQDLIQLVEVFKALPDLPDPEHIFLVGPSEGGLITALAVEQHPDIFDGGLATCGPVGSFCGQMNYWGDTRVVFNYFFPGVLPWDPGSIDVPQDLMDNWDVGENYEQKVRDALTADPHATEQLVRVAKIPVDPENPGETAIEAIVQVLWYNVFATNDGKAKLGGSPFDNARRWYHGSDNDRRLNRKVKRFSADPAAIQEIREYYETSGDLTSHLITMHNLGDPAVPYWHEPLYRAKVWRNQDGRLHTNIPSPRYGHCNFTVEGVLVAFALLHWQVTGECLDVGGVLPGA